MSDENMYTMEILKIAATIIAPIITGGFALYILKSGILVEKDKNLNQEIIKRRLKFFDDVAPSLNRIYCFYRVVGDWHSLTPEDVIKLKREVDRQFHMYRYILSNEVFLAYESFMKVYFQEFAADGIPARLRADRQHMSKLMKDKYDARWEVGFADLKDCHTWNQHHEAYNALMAKLGSNVIGGNGESSRTFILRK